MTDKIKLLFKRITGITLSIFGFSFILTIIILFFIRDEAFYLFNSLYFDNNLFIGLLEKYSSIIISAFIIYLGFIGFIKIKKGLFEHSYDNINSKIYSYIITYYGVLNIIIWYFIIYLLFNLTFTGIFGYLIKILIGLVYFILLMQIRNNHKNKLSILIILLYLIIIGLGNGFEFILLITTSMFFIYCTKLLESYLNIFNNYNELVEINSYGNIELNNISLMDLTNLNFENIFIHIGNLPKLILLFIMKNFIPQIQIAAIFIAFFIIYLGFIYNFNLITILFIHVTFILIFYIITLLDNKFPGMVDVLLKSEKIEFKNVFLLENSKDRIVLLDENNNQFFVNKDEVVYINLIPNKK